MAALMTKIDAVNKCLEAIWEQPVSTLDVSGVGSVAQAKRVIDDVSRTVQGRGWAFNTEHGLTLTPDVNKKIMLGPNVLRCDTVDADRALDVVNRGQQLYDRGNHTYDFSAPIKVEQVLLLDFEQLPQSARSYIALQAARVFRDKWNQAESPSTPSQEETLALLAFEEEEGDVNDSNMFTDSWSVASILCR